MVIFSLLFTNKMPVFGWIVRFFDACTRVLRPEVVIANMHHHQSTTVPLSCELHDRDRMDRVAHSQS